ncbi:MAG: hypothetical protein HRT90_11475 [Candidatus Margulisbacteria bacterium]|nr:hypothetical protein [Candidatus Margulisiibacteriota bacterium]
MNTILVSSFFAVFTNLLLGIFVLIRNPRKAVNLTFSLFVFSNAWAIFGDIFYHTPLVNIWNILAWIKVAYIGGVFCPTFLMHFIIIFTQIQVRTTIILLLYIISCIFLISNIYSEHFFSSAVLNNNMLTLETGLIYNMFIVYIAFSLLLALTIAIWKLCYGSHKVKKRMRYFLFSIVAVIIAALFYFSAIKGFYQIRIDNLSLVLFSAIIAYAITKKGLLDINVVIKKNVAFFFVFLLLVISVVLSSFYTIQNTEINILVMVILCLFWAFSAIPLQKYLITTARRKFIRGWYDPEQVFNSISRKLKGISDRESILKVVEGELDESLEIQEIGCIFAKRDSLERITSYISKYQDPEKNIQTTNALIHFFKSNIEPIMVSKLPRKVRATTQELGISYKCVMIPFSSPGTLEGIIILGEREIQSPYTEKEFNLFSTIINYVSAVLYAMSPYEKIQKEFNATQKKLYESEIQLLRSECRSKVIMS